MTAESKTRENTRLPEVRDATGRWAPGAPSPNPAGRPSIPLDVKLAAKAHTHDMINVLVDVATNPKSPPSARVAAANAILDRGHGKPAQSIEASVERLDIAQMHLEELKRLAEKGREDQRRRGFVPPGSAGSSE